MQSLPDTPVRINVLGAIGRAQAQKSRDVPAMVVVAVAGAGLLLLPGVHGFWQGAKVGGRLAERTAQVDEASAALQRLEAENKKFIGAVQRAELALKLERERLRWPQLLAELKRHSQKKVWITSLQVEAGAKDSEVVPPGGKPAAPHVKLVEIGGMFETQSEKADAEAVANFQKALEGGGVLRKVEVLEREAPQYVDGKANQVALKFRLKAEWPEEAPVQTAGAGGGG